MTFLKCRRSLNLSLLFDSYTISGDILVFNNFNLKFKIECKHKIMPTVPLNLELRIDLRFDNSLLKFEMLGSYSRGNGF